MQIHSQDEPPFIDQLGFGVAPGFQTFVSCQQQRVSGHGARGWAQTPQGWGWAPAGVGMDPQRAQHGDLKGSEWTLKEGGPVRTLQAMGTTAMGTPRAQPCHGVQHGVWGSPRAGPAAPVQAAAPAETPGSRGTAAGGVAAPGPRSQTPKFRCLGWVSPRVPAQGRHKHGGSSDVALAPTGGGCWGFTRRDPCAKGTAGGPC